MCAHQGQEVPEQVYTPFEVSLQYSNDLIQLLDLISFRECIFSGFPVEGIQGPFPFNLILQGNNAIILRFIQWLHIYHGTNLLLRTKRSQSLSCIKNTGKKEGAKTVPFGNCLFLLKKAPKQFPYGKVPECPEVADFLLF